MRAPEEYRPAPPWPLVIGGSIAPGMLAWTIGVSEGQSVLLTVVVFALVGGYHLLPEVRELDWPALDYERSVRSRRDVSRLSWALTGSGSMVPLSGIIQLERLAAQRLAVRGIDPSDEARVATSLGPVLSRILAERPTTMRYETFARCVVALEQLDELPLAPHTGISLPEGLSHDNT